MTNKENILQVLEAMGVVGICDDCLEIRSEVRNRRQINTICRELRDLGRIERRHGSCAFGQHDKILNFICRQGVSRPADVVSLPIEKASLSIKEQTNILSEWLFDAGKFLDRVDRTPIHREPFAARVARLKREGQIGVSLSAVMQMLNTFRVRVVKERSILDNQEWQLTLQGIAKCRSEWPKVAV